MSKSRVVVSLLRKNGRVTSYNSWWFWSRVNRSKERPPFDYCCWDRSMWQYQWQSYCCIFLSGFLGESLDVLGDSGLQHLVLNDLVELRTILEEEGQRVALKKLHSVILQKMRRFWTVTLKWKVAIGHQSRQRRPDLLQVSGESYWSRGWVEESASNEGVLLSKLEKKAMKRMLLCWVELGEPMEGSRALVVTIYSKP